jgi:hypothetical protein
LSIGDWPLSDQEKMLPFLLANDQFSMVNAQFFACHFSAFCGLR